MRPCSGCHGKREGGSIAPPDGAFGCGAGPGDSSSGAQGASRSLPKLQSARSVESSMDTRPFTRFAAPTGERACGMSLGHHAASFGVTPLPRPRVGGLCQASARSDSAGGDPARTHRPRLDACVAMPPRHDSVACHRAAHRRLRSREKAEAGGRQSRATPSAGSGRLPLCARAHSPPTAAAALSGARVPTTAA